MRFLKTKILRAKEAVDRKTATDLLVEPIDLKLEAPAQEIPIVSEPSTQQSSPSHSTPAGQIAEKLSKTRQKQSFGQTRKSQKRDPNGSSRATKNIVINFGKAIASFAGSPLAVPYLKSILEKQGLSNKEFSEFVGEAKSGIGGIDSFRSLVWVSDSDSDQLAACKKAFVEVGAVFIKYFSVNWITHGRVINKLVYLKYRMKVLRRMQNPEVFTYISEGKKRC